jgi:hypothetical protein
MLDDVTTCDEPPLRSRNQTPKGQITQIRRGQPHPVLVRQELNFITESLRQKEACHP